MFRRRILTIFISLCAIIAWDALAWKPSGWVYHNGNYAYSSSLAGWYYFRPADTQWRIDLATDTWGTLKDASGWIYYRWPYAYSSNAGRWYWHAAGSVQWCSSTSSGRWSLLGQDLAPAGMALVPAGSFTYSIGADFGAPADVYLAAFYIDKYEVCNDKVLAAFQWAADNDRLEFKFGTRVLNSGGVQKDLLDIDAADCRISWNGSSFALKEPKGSGYPCVCITWYGAAAYCNFRSEMEGRRPCYDFSDWSCDRSANGYRLPADAEWEKAAKGGASGRRFPWGDTVNHDYANYLACNCYDWAGDTSPYSTSTFHPDWDDSYPYTSPIASFPLGSNAYGIVNMSGNVQEWCDSLYDGSPYVQELSPSSDRAASLFAQGALRGGSFSQGAPLVKVDSRAIRYPYNSYPDSGFRTVVTAQ